ncbi:unnamed protein product, partial [Mesorhabditis belari]|uniref:C-type lectin domain-containing protein n=1 Tax=Mesorhabditis belari TaxID=2138241 RepID=A0AAF3FA26_9BILA
MAVERQSFDDERDASLLTICRAQLASTQTKLKDEKGISQSLKGNLNECEAERTVLRGAKISSDKELREISAIESKCPFTWRYYNETNSCYYYQGFSKDGQGKMITYDWETAEANCVLMGGHLVSIHSTNEKNFVKKLIAFNVKGLNPSATSPNPCAYSEFYVWNGLRITNGKRKWIDGTNDDYYSKNDDYKAAHDYLMCNDEANENNYHYYGPIRLNARYVCKKAAIN